MVGAARRDVRTPRQGVPTKNRFALSNQRAHLNLLQNMPLLAELNQIKRKTELQRCRAYGAMLTANGIYRFWHHSQASLEAKYL